jgi:hypothetical protein
LIHRRSRPVRLWARVKVKATAKTSSWLSKPRRVTWVMQTHPGYVTLWFSACG